MIDKIITKLTNGDHLTDEELKKFLKFSKDVTDSLYQCGERFVIVAKEMRRLHDAAHYMSEARKNRA